MDGSQLCASGFHLQLSGGYLAGMTVFGGLLWGWGIHPEELQSQALLGHSHFSVQWLLLAVSGSYKL